MLKFLGQSSSDHLLINRRLLVAQLQLNQINIGLGIEVFQVGIKRMIKVEQDFKIAFSLKRPLIIAIRCYTYKITSLLKNTR